MNNLSKYFGVGIAGPLLSILLYILLNGIDSKVLPVLIVILVGACLAAFVAVFIKKVLKLKKHCLLFSSVISVLIYLCTFYFYAKGDAEARMWMPVMLVTLFFFSFSTAYSISYCVLGLMDSFAKK